MKNEETINAYLIERYDLSEEELASVSAKVEEAKNGISKILDAFYMMRDSQELAYQFQQKCFKKIEDARQAGDWNNQLLGDINQDALDILDAANVALSSIADAASEARGNAVLPILAGLKMKDSVRVKPGDNSGDDERGYVTNF